MRIVFMGTPDFAVPCLLRLVEDGHDVAAVFSQPDKPRGRGRELSPTEVKAAALQHNIPVFQPVKLRDGEALKTLEALAPELIVVVAYGRILPGEILKLPKYGCVNVHASLLPKYRGAAPIQWSVINGDRVTGLATMHMAEQLDAGDIILRRETEIGEDETAGELFVRLAPIGAQLLSETIGLIEDGTAPREPQDEKLATFAPPIDKSLGKIDFHMEARPLCNLVRGLNPSPGAFTKYGGKILKLLAAKPAPDYSGKIGEVLDAKRLIVGCGDCAVELVLVAPEGKRPMSGAEYARGRRFVGSEMFTTD